MSSLYEGTVLLGGIILVLAVFAAASILGSLLSLLGLGFLAYLGIKAILEL
jgi:threonine/homoserine/homoserine lactone efflux protein